MLLHFNISAKIFQINMITIIQKCPKQYFMTIWGLFKECNASLKLENQMIISVQFSSSFSLSRVWLCSLMACSMPGFPVHHQSQSLLKLMSTKSVKSSNLLIVCHPLLLLPSILLSIRVFSDESACHIRWPKYWNFSFSISSSNEYSGLISFRMDWLDHWTGSPVNMIVFTTL